MEKTMRTEVADGSRTTNDGSLILKEFAPPTEALSLKEIGFDEPCIYAWCTTPKHRIGAFGEMYMRTDGNPFGEFYKGKNWNVEYPTNKNKIQCSAPTYSQAFSWFIERYGFYNQIHKGYGWEGIIRNSVNGDIEWHDGTYNTPEEAELACLRKLIEIASVERRCP